MDESDTQEIPEEENYDENHSSLQADKENLLHENKALVIIQPKYKIVVEPILIILTLCYYPLFLTQGLFTYHRFEIAAAKELGFNMPINSHQHCDDVNTTSPEYKVTHKAQEDNAMFNIVLGFAGTIPCLFTTVFLGPYSDRAGRRYAIIIPLLTGFCNVMVMFLIVQFELSIWYLLIGAFIDGLGGKFTMVLLGCFAYIADTSAAEDRQFRITVLECIFFMSGVVGPIGVGNLIYKYGYVWPVLFVGFGYFIVICYSLFFVPETIIPDPKAKFWTTNQIKALFRLFTKDTADKRMWKLRWLYLAFLPVIMVVMGDQITTLFLQNVPFCWNSAKIGDYMAIYIGVCAVGGIVSAKLLKFCLPDHGIALISAFSSAVRNIYHGFVTTDLMVYFVPAFGVFSMLFVPTIRAMMSQLVGPREQGAVFGAIAISEVIFSFAGTFIFSAIYASTLSFMSGFVYFVEALFYLLGFLLLLFYIIRLRKINQSNVTNEDTENIKYE